MVPQNAINELNNVMMNHKSVDLWWSIQWIHSSWYSCGFNAFRAIYPTKYNNMNILHSGFNDVIISPTQPNDNSHVCWGTMWNKGWHGQNIVVYLSNPTSYSHCKCSQLLHTINMSHWSFTSSTPTYHMCNTPYQ